MLSESLCIENGASSSIASTVYSLPTSELSFLFTTVLVVAIVYVKDRRRAPGSWECNPGLSRDLQNRVIRAITVLCLPGFALVGSWI